MSKYREWILDTIDSLRSRKARPDLERICRMVRRRHGSEPERTCAELEKLIQEQSVLKVNYKGSISYRNAAKVQRRSRRKDDTTTAASAAASAASAPASASEAAAAARRNAAEEASHSDLSNGDSALGPTDQDEAEDLEGDGSMVMDTDSNADEEGAEESRDGQDGPSPPNNTFEDAAVQFASTHAFSAPCSPLGSRPGPGSASGASPVRGLICASAWKANERARSLPPSSPRALAHSDWAYDASVCPAEPHHPAAQKDKGALKPAEPSSTTSPPVPKSTVKTENGGRMEDSPISTDQLVPDFGTRPDESSDGGAQTLPLPSDNCAHDKNNIDTDSLMTTEEAVVNGVEDHEISVKKEKTGQNLLQWSVADVASYFSAAGFPEQAVAFRTQEIDGKSLLLMQRTDVLTGLSIRLGPALKIYERHVKVLQRTHFLEDEDL